MVGDPRGADGRQQGRVHPHRQEESARDVPQLGLGQSDIPVRRAAEEISAGAMRAADAGGPLTGSGRKNAPSAVAGRVLSTIFRYAHRAIRHRLSLEPAPLGPPRLPLISLRVNSAIELYNRLLYLSVFTYKSAI